MCIILADERHDACVAGTVRKRMGMRKQVFRNKAPNRSQRLKTYSAAREAKDWNG